MCLWACLGRWALESAHVLCRDGRLRVARRASRSGPGGARRWARPGQPCPGRSRAETERRWLAASAAGSEGVGGRHKAEPLALATGGRCARAPKQRRRAAVNSRTRAWTRAPRRLAGLDGRLHKPRRAQAAPGTARWTRPGTMRGPAVWAHRRAAPHAAWLR